MIRRADLDNALERDFQAEVLRLARLANWRCYHTHDSRRSSPGFPDLVMVKQDHLIFAELKRKGGKLTPEQLNWMHDLASVRHVHGFVWTPDLWPEIERTLATRLTVE
jgi:hypothetical protein